MPSRYLIRDFENGSFYHVFNRGVEKRITFCDDLDFKVFVYYLSVFLSDPETIDESHPFFVYKRHNFYKRVTLAAYCLMGNHYHLLLQQQDDDAISEFMKALSNAYTQYFNKKYDRVGPLFQGRYKCRKVDEDSYFTLISKYIHLNPSNPYDYSYSSINQYLYKNEVPWINTDLVLGSFNSRTEYKSFLEDHFSFDDEEEKIFS